RRGGEGAGGRVRPHRPRPRQGGGPPPGPAGGGVGQTRPAGSGRPPRASRRAWASRGPPGAGGGAGAAGGASLPGEAGTPTAPPPGRGGGAGEANPGYGDRSLRIAIRHAHNIPGPRVASTEKVGTPLRNCGAPSVPPRMATMVFINARSDTVRIPIAAG